MIYLDNAATSWPKPQEVINAVSGAMAKAGGNPGRSGHALSLRAGRLVYACREQLAGYFDTKPDRFAFTSNGTAALNLAIKGMVRPGGHVIATCMEHNSVLRPLYTLKALGLIELTILEPEKGEVTFSPGDFLSSVRPDTVLAVCTHASNLTGAVQPVEEIARALKKKGVPLLADGAQAAGHVKIDLEASDIALYAFPGHKGLLGPQGTGALWIREGVWPDTLTEGGTGSYSHILSQPEEMPDRYEAGTLNGPGLAGLAAGVKYLTVRENPASACAALFYERIRRLPVRLISHPAHLACGIVSFAARDADSVSVSEALSQAGICVRGGLHCAPLAHRFFGTGKTGAVRVSFGYANTPDEAENCAKEVERFLRRASFSRA